LLTCTIALAAELPADVQSFIHDREGCDHFRGEPFDSGNAPDIKERREFILQKLKQLCAGTDQRLANLRRKYRSDRDLSARLSGYEDTIEASKGRQ
jgi:hypothetical protein